MLPHRANPKTRQCPEHPGSEPRPTSTAHLIIVTGLTENLRMHKIHLIYKFPAWTTVQNVTNPIRRTAVSDYSYNNKKKRGGGKGKKKAIHHILTKITWCNYWHILKDKYAWVRCDIEHLVAYQYQSQPNPVQTIPNFLWTFHIRILYALSPPDHNCWFLPTLNYHKPLPFLTVQGFSRGALTAQQSTGRWKQRCSKAAGDQRFAAARLDARLLWFPQLQWKQSFIMPTKRLVRDLWFHIITIRNMCHYPPELITQLETDVSCLGDGISQRQMAA